MGKGKRIKMRIYKIPQGVELELTANRPNSQYIQGKTTEDIEQNDTIYLSAENVPGITFPLNTPYIGAIQYLNPEVYKVGDESYVQINDQSGNTFTFYLQEKTTDTAETTFFEFYINPQRVEPVYNKRVTEVQVRNGYEVQHWGDTLTEVRVTGKSGAMIKRADGSTPTESEFDVTESLAWKRLQELRTLYSEDHSNPNTAASTLLGMDFYDKFLIGYFSGFSGPNVTSDNPYQVEYSFTFKVQKEVNIS